MLKHYWLLQTSIISASLLLEPIGEISAWSNFLLNAHVNNIFRIKSHTQWHIWILWGSGPRPWLLWILYHLDGSTSFQMQSLPNTCIEMLFSLHLYATSQSKSRTTLSKMPLLFVVDVVVHFHNFPQSRSQLRVPLFLDNDVGGHFGLGPIGPAGTAFHAKIMKMFILF